MLTDGKVWLAPFFVHHADAVYLSWFDTPAVKQFIARRPASLEEAKRYVLDKVADPHCWFFRILLSDRPIGTLKLDLDAREKTVCWLGLMIGDASAHGQGIGPRAIWLGCCYAFDHLGAVTVKAGISRENLASIRAFEKTGFQIGEFPDRPADVLAWKER